MFLGFTIPIIVARASSPASLGVLALAWLALPILSLHSVVQNSTRAGLGMPGFEQMDSVKLKLVIAKEDIADMRVVPPNRREPLNSWLG